MKIYSKGGNYRSGKVKLPNPSEMYDNNMDVWAINLNNNDKGSKPIIIVFGRGNSFRNEILAYLTRKDKDEIDNTIKWLKLKKHGFIDRALEGGTFPREDGKWNSWCSSKVTTYGITVYRHINAAFVYGDKTLRNSIIDFLNYGGEATVILAYKNR